METLLALTSGVLFAASFYLLLRRNLLRFIVGLIMMSNAVNLLIFTMGRLTQANPPIIPHGQKVPTEPYANPLPQALILTAIVISFGLLAFTLVLIYRNYQSTDTLDVDALMAAEPLSSIEPDREDQRLPV